ncbi:MAG TPA: cobyric acid synthase [Ktedonobacteraceae bacterium]
MKKMAQTLMVQGTASSVGKSTLVAGLCRIFAWDGWRVAPFKAQNMALNSFVTRSGGEIGRAQAVQAEAAGIEPTVAMNPILLKPEGDTRSQVIVMGRPLMRSEARAYYQQRDQLLSVVQQALASLRAEYDLVIIEGAGSPVELNLARYDLVNMVVARMVDAPVILVGDIDRSGIFASLLGTLHLLPPEDQARVKGLVVNKFRGDLALWKPGEQLLAEKSGVPVLGTVPFLPDLGIAEEDSGALDEKPVYTRHDARATTSDRLEIVVVRLPYMSNYDEFDALIAETLVHVRFAVSVEEFPARPDLIVLPGSKNTLRDLAWLWRQGLAQHIRFCTHQGSALLGICGGYQMLGERVSDLVGAEAEVGTVEAGLNLLPVETFFAPIEAKVTTQSQPWVAATAQRGLFAHMPGQPFQAYQIHMGNTVPVQERSGTAAFQLASADANSDGWLSSDGWRAGCYFHGLFENEHFRRGLLTALAERHSTGIVPLAMASFDRQTQYDRWADFLCLHLDLARLKLLCHLED